MFVFVILLGCPNRKVIVNQYAKQVFLGTSMMFWRAFAGCPGEGRGSPDCFLSTSIKTPGNPFKINSKTGFQRLQFSFIFLRGFLYKSTKRKTPPLRFALGLLWAFDLGVVCEIVSSCFGRVLGCWDR